MFYSYTSMLSSCGLHEDNDRASADVDEQRHVFSDDRFHNHILNRVNAILPFPSLPRLAISTEDMNAGHSLTKHFKVVPGGRRQTRQN